MYYDIDEEYRIYEQSLAVATIEETIERCSVPFTHEELMETLDLIKQRLQARYEAEQERRRKR